MTVSALLGCVKIVPSPFQQQEAGASDAAPPADAAIEADESGDALTGKVCTIDEDCDDEISCTFDACDTELRRCKNTPDDLSCQNGRYCDGQERCDPKLGCREGEPVTCSDIETCTIDKCVEQSATCEHVLRDMDGDGDPDYHCTGGSDCNDLDGSINSKAPEVCANKKDDNCDGQVDEEPCTVGKYDTCSEPLLLQSGKAELVAMAGAKLDYSGSCVPTGSYSVRDIVGAISVPAGSSMDLDVIAKVTQGATYTAVASQCADPASELGCAPGASSPSAGMVSRLLTRALPEGAYPVYVWTDGGAQDVLVSATLRPAQPAPTNETCASASPITPGAAVTAEILDCMRDLDTSCGAVAGDLVYKFETTEAHDVRVFASSADGVGNPVIGLRAEPCIDKSSELSCASGASPVVFVRSLPAGVYYVDVSASAPSMIQFTVMLFPPTVAPADESCASAPSMEPGKTLGVTLQDHTDDVKATCLGGAPDAAYALSLSELSDVLVVGRISQNDYGAVSLLLPQCEAADLVACAASSPSPVRTSAHALADGDYRVVIETQKGDPTQLTAFVRPAQAPVFVLFSETCGDAQPIGPQGGFFQGNTSNAAAHYAAGCDQAGGSAVGAPDQMLKLELSAKKRVVFDMRGSDYRTLLNVRKGPACPGQELQNSCSVGYYDQRSYLDLILDAGQYWVQVDGFYGETGQWFLDVFVAEP